PRRPWPATTPPAGPDNCQVGGLDLVAGRAEGDEPLEPLDLAIVVVVPDLVAFDRPAPAPSAADLAAVTGFGGDPAAQPVPHRRRGVAADCWCTCRSTGRARRSGGSALPHHPRPLRRAPEWTTDRVGAGIPASRSRPPPRSYAAE